MNVLGIGTVYTSFGPVAGGSVSLEESLRLHAQVPGVLSAGLSAALSLFWLCTWSEPDCLNEFSQS